MTQETLISQWIADNDLYIVFIYKQNFINGRLNSKKIHYVQGQDHVSCHLRKNVEVAAVPIMLLEELLDITLEQK